MSQSLSPLQIKTALRVAKQVRVVFEAIVDPVQMSNYFISHGSNRMEEGKTVHWSFPEMEGSFPVQVIKVMDDKEIIFTWNDTDGSETTVTITLQPVSETVTFVTITEGEKAATDDGIRWLKSNTEGWANFLACLKAFLEYGISLRKGAFDPSQMPVQEA
ncbi:SRPBCC domain-containing protein [Flavisolibacter sp. BT320]|nr:SRPBCC domain-containing protein [Flavisolibacter longurius]